MAHSESTRFERIFTLLIHPQVFIGKRQMNENERLQQIYRNCYICNRTLYWGEFIRSAEDLAFDNDMLKIIWENDIFILKCCSCFRHNRTGQFNDAIDALTHSLSYYLNIRNRQRWHLEYEQNPVL